MLTICALFIFNACSSKPKIMDVTKVTDREWMLTEIKTKPRNITLNRNDSESKGFGNSFTLRFDAERLGGVGAPNRYTAPYKIDQDQSIEVKDIAATLMAPIQELTNLKEHEYFAYLQNAYKWHASKGKLELHTKNKDGVKAVLIYTIVVY